jgi:hypothetical protein
MRRSSVLSLTVFIAALLAIEPVRAVFLPPYEGDGISGATDSVDFPINPDWLRDGDSQGDEFGHSVAGAGDVNGDGYGELIVGAAKATYTQSREGVAYVFYGAPQGPEIDPDWLAGGDQKGSEFGASVNGAGDVNGDTYDDVIVGAPLYGQPETGRAFVFYGSATGLSATPDWSAGIGLRDARFGVSVSGAGDVNKDGYDDVIVGAQGYTDGEALEGGAFVFYGSPSGPITTTMWVAQGNQASALFGSSVSGAGDVNGDGYDDVIVGAPQYDNGESNEGAAFVFFGSESGLSAGPDWMAEGDQAEAEFGVAVGTAGRVNDDVYGDVIVGAVDYDGSVADVGAAFVYYGSADGLADTPNWSALGSQEHSGFGCAVGGGGDVNRDGFDDVIVGADRFDYDQSLEGAAFVYSGSSGGLSGMPVWRLEGNKADTRFGAAVGVDPTINNDDFADLVVGAPQYRIEGLIHGRAYAYFGSEITGYRFFVRLPVLISGGP